MYHSVHPFVQRALCAFCNVLLIIFKTSDFWYAIHTGPSLNMWEDIFESISMREKPNFNFLYLLVLADIIKQHVMSICQ